MPPQRPRRCEADCHGRGVCNAATGVCACRAGYNGSSCGTLNPRPCNGGKNDGLWHGSHCAGECDERRGFCWCPGRLRERPMADTCQVKHMPLEAFAALTLKPDPAWVRFHSNGSRMDAGVLSLPRPEQRRRPFQAGHKISLHVRLDLLHVKVRNHCGLGIEAELTSRKKCFVSLR